MILCQRDEEFGYKATKEEHHPSHVVNGRATIDFFRDSFQMTGREVVALFGAHTFGRFIFLPLRALWTRQAALQDQPGPLHVDQQGHPPLQ